MQYVLTSSSKLVFFLTNLRIQIIKGQYVIFITYKINI
jgi:hypothetical protein